MFRMFYPLRSRFLNMKIRNKVFFIFILVGVIPFLCYITLSNRFTNQLILERETTLTELALDQAVTYMENKLETYNNLSNYMFNNTSILEVLNKEYGTDYFQMYKAYQDTIEPLFQTYYALHPDLLNLTIYSSCDLHPYNGYIQSFSVLSGQEWFSLVSGRYSPTWTILEEDGEKSLYSTRLIGDSRKYRTLNYLCLQVDYESLFAPLYTVSEGDYRIVITDSAGSLVFSNVEIPASLDTKTDISGIMTDGSGKGHMLLTNQIHAAGWQVHFSKSYDSLVDYVNSITGVIYAFGWIILVFLGIMVLIITVSIVSPIETLTAKIRELRNGDMSHLTVDLEDNRKDEIGVLFRNFSRMMGQIHHYIEVNLKNELEKKNYQQKILYAQINPHFLYNSLSLINSRAILSGQDDISNMVILLSTFYRTALNKGKDTTTLENELQNIQAYIQIQLLSYSEYIQVIYDIDYSLSPVTFPNFILQPLVENALDHGLKNSLREDKCLTITVERESPDREDPDYVPSVMHVIIRIEDNGIGMDEETVSSLFRIKTSGYGLKNVNDRLKLLYGNDFRLTITSRAGEGTLTVLKVPLDPS